MAVVGPLAVPAKEAGVRLSSISRSDVRKGDRFGGVSGNRQMGFGRKSGWFRAKMASNGYVGVGGWSKRDSGGFQSPRVYKRLDSCLIVPPAKGREVRGVVQFLGGAFIGAVPEATYRYMFELLAKEGFLIVSVPYNVTFDHLQAAKEVYEKFNTCLDVLLVSGLPDYGLMAEEIAQLPLFSVGHSNGALLQVLVGSLFSEKLPKANAVIAYNNRPAAEAVPYFEQVGPLLSQMMPLVESSPLYSMARSASDDAWKVILETTGQLVSNVDEEAMVSLTKFTDQLPKVLSQVMEGVSEFRPTPSENCDCFSRSYKVPHTLLVKFDVDAIDETDLLERTLKPRVESIGGTLEKVTLSGNHITPCIQEPKWQVGAVYTPADAIAQGLKTLSLNDIRTLSRTISDWFRRYEN
uniref:Uncharacterized protein n=1 Tax=Kalanchoe fedtschenkoi TaxID=63787 RepID=A0A7N0UT91_KALFE